MLKKLFGVLVLVFLFFGSVVAQERQSTTIFQVLQLPLTAYDASMANTSISGLQSALNNPAVLPYAQNSIMVSHAVYFADTNYTVASANYNLTKKSSLSFSFLYFSYGSMRKTIESDSKGYEDLGYFGASDKLFSLSYARNINDRLTLGASLKYISQNIDDVSYDGIGVNLSGLYFLKDGLSVGCGINNLGPKVEEYALPTNLYFAMTGYITKRLSFVGQFDDYYNDSIMELKFGLEYEPIDIISCRAGYTMPIQKELPDNDDLITNFTFGIGLKFKGIIFDYAWLPKGELDNVHMFSLCFKL